MTELKDLSKGDSVTLTVKAEVVSANEGSVDVMYSSGNGDWFTIQDSDIEDGSVVIEAVEKRILPTEDGWYIASHMVRNGAVVSNPAIVKMFHDKWYGDTGGYDSAKEYAKYLSENFGLTRVRLEPVK